MLHEKVFHVNKTRLLLHKKIFITQKSYRFFLQLRATRHAKEYLYFNYFDRFAETVKKNIRKNSSYWKRS